MIYLIVQKLVTLNVHRNREVTTQLVEPFAYFSDIDDANKQLQHLYGTSMVIYTDDASLVVGEVVHTVIPLETFASSAVKQEADEGNDVEITADPWDLSTNLLQLQPTQVEVVPAEVPAGVASMNASREITGKIHLPHDLKTLEVTNSRRITRRVRCNVLWVYSAAVARSNDLNNYCKRCFPQ